MTYARARLWLGMTTVGTLVAASLSLLYFEIPARMLASASDSFADHVAALGVCVGMYVCAHLTSDLFGAVFIPRLYGRLQEPVATVMARLARGILAHGAILWMIAVALLAAGTFAAMPGVLAASLAAVIGMLGARRYLARIIGSVNRDEVLARSAPAHAILYSSPDPGFTGGIEGVFKPDRITVPKAWQESLSATELKSVLERRHSAIANGSWLRGRVLAIAFTVLGVAFAAWLAGPETLDTAAGLVRLSLWFTVWSFFGLLTLPTLSRNAVLSADLQAGLDETAIEALARLDRIGDDEPKRTKIIEAVFHPVPSLQLRQSGARRASKGYWDVARTALFMSLGGLGLLGRSVHCNAGRPALWVYLPSA